MPLTSRTTGRFEKDAKRMQRRGKDMGKLRPDWLPIYQLDPDWILFECTGTHSDLFE